MPPSIRITPITSRPEEVARAFSAKVYKLAGFRVINLPERLKYTGPHEEDAVREGSFRLSLLLHLASSKSN